jgi:hypothetical protein
MRKPRSKTSLIIILPAVLGICHGTALADAPQFTVAAAQYAFNTHSQNWACDAQSEISPPTKNCYSPYPPASYTFAHHGHITQNPTTGAYVWLMDGGARDGGFENRPGDTLTSFASPGPQGGTHLLRKTSIEHPAYPNPPYHWELFSTLYDPSRGKFYAFANVTETGQIPNAQENILFVGESDNGVENFTWTKVYENRRPTASALFFNRDHYILDPGDPGRWIGFLGWGDFGALSGMAPSYIDMDRGKFGVLFQSEGWCEYPLGHVFDSFDPNATCASQGSALPDLPYQIPELVKSSTRALALVNGKAIVLYNEGTSQACADTDDACIQSRTPCPPGQDWTLYRTRRNDPDWGFGTRWWVRELSPATWNTSLNAAQWTGPAKVILDGTQAAQFKINPSDIGVGGYDAALKQFADGRVYMYLTIKHSLCLPASNPPEKAWDRNPKGNSGASMMWFRLTYTP